MQYFDVALATTFNSRGNQPKLAHAEQVQAACKEISAYWGADQRNERRVEAKRLQSQLFLMLLENVDCVDQRILADNV